MAEKNATANKYSYRIPIATDCGKILTNCNTCNTGNYEIDCFQFAPKYKGVLAIIMEIQQSKNNLTVACMDNPYLISKTNITQP